MSRRRVFAITTFVAPLLAVAAACSFPDVTFGPAAEPGEGGPPTEGSADGSANQQDAFVLADGAVTGDVVVRDDATARVDANSCDDANCDCDKDTYPRAGCDAGDGKPVDCDDFDPLRHPNAGLTDAVPEGHEGDWNCNKAVEVEPARSLKCGGNGTLGCTGGSGFIGAPGCGTKADFYSCEPQANILAQCQPKPTGVAVTQYCK